MNASVGSPAKNLINRLEEGLLAFLLAFMTLITFVQVVLRYVFNTGLLWSLEATTYSFGALVLIGLSYGVRTKSHIAVDLLTRRLPEKIRYAAALLALVFCLIYVALMFYGSAVLVERLYALGNFARDLPAPKWVLTLTMPMGFALLFYRLLEVGRSIYQVSSADYCADLDANAAGESPAPDNETDQGENR